MPIERNVAIRQIERLAGIPSPGPQTEAALADLVDVLAEFSRSEGHARRTITELLENPGDPPRWPTIATIRSVAWGLLTDDDKAHRCDACGGTGWVHRVRRIWMIGQLTPYDFSGRCKRCGIPEQTASDAHSLAS